MAFLIPGHKNESMWVKIGSCKIWKNSNKNFIELNIDGNLKFNQYF